MKRIFLALFTLISFVSLAQIFTPVDWEFSQKQLSDNEIELQFKASLEEHWHLYSQHIDDDGPVPTEFTFTTADGYDLIGGVNEGEPLEEFDPNFDMVLKYFGDEAIFTQKIKVTSGEDFILEGNVYFMVCDEAQCLPPEEVEFSFEINGTAAAEEQEENKEEGMWWLFISALGAGLLALFMPCTFPMIPMTVSFFTKQSKTRSQGIRNAIFYGVSIIVIYIIVGVLVSRAFGSDSANLMANNVYFNIAFAILLLVFGLLF